MRSTIARAVWAPRRAAAWAPLLLLALPLGAQEAVRPTNDAPNPYRTIEGWAKLPEGRTWGSTSAVAIDRDGVSVWVAERCGVNSCVGSDLDPVMLFAPDGTLVRSFGKGLINWPHGIWVDHENNVWIADGRDNRPRAGEREPDDVFGHQVLKFSPEGELLMTLGERGGGRDSAFFWQPNDVLVTPEGVIFVAEGHSSREAANARILKFAPDGTLLLTFGRKGTADGEFDQPHALALDSQGRLFVGDRSNDRIQIFTQDGEHLDTWYQFSRPSGLWIDAHDTLYVADSESGSIEPARPEWLRGIRIGSVRDGKVAYFIPDPDVDARSTSAAEGVAVDRNGVIYGAEVGPRALKRYVRKP